MIVMKTIDNSIRLQYKETHFLMASVLLLRQSVP